MDESFNIDENLCEHVEVGGVHKHFSGSTRERPLEIKVKKAFKVKEFPKEVSGHKTKKKWLKAKSL